MIGFELQDRGEVSVGRIDGDGLYFDRPIGPGDAYALEAIRMTPRRAVLMLRHSSSWPTVGERFLAVGAESIWRIRLEGSAAGNDQHIGRARVVSRRSRGLRHRIVVDFPEGWRTEPQP